MREWLAGIAAAVIVWLLTKEILPKLLDKTPPHFSFWIGMVVLATGGLLYLWFNRTLPVLEISINNFDKTRKVISGKVVLSSNKQFYVLIFAGKAGGPYWLQGASGSLFSETGRKQVGAQWEASWMVPEIHIGPNVVDLRAVAILPGKMQKIIKIIAGTPDPQTGNTIKVNTLDNLPKRKTKISSIFDPT